MKSDTRKKMEFHINPLKLVQIERIVEVLRLVMSLHHAGHG